MEPVAPAYLDWLPDEALLELLIQTDDLDTLARWCQTSRRVAGLCQDEGFWRQKYLNDFQDSTPLTEGDTWRKRYKFIASTKRSSPVSAGTDHYGVIDEIGLLHMSGINDFGQLGDNTYQPSFVPKVIPFTSKVISLSCGHQITGAVTKDGKAYIWGKNQPKIMDVDLDRINLPQLLELPRKAIKIACGKASYAIILDDYSVYFKARFMDRLKIPASPHLSIKVVDISVEDDSFMAASMDGGVYIWGAGYGKLGLLGVFAGKVEPLEYKLTEQIKQVSLRSNHFYLVSFGGHVLELKGVGTPNPKIQAVLIGHSVSYLSSGHLSTSAISKEGKVFFWGKSQVLAGSIGYESIPRGARTRSGLYVFNPTEVSISNLVVHIANSDNFAVAITNDGYVNLLGHFPGYQTVASNRLKN